MNIRSVNSPISVLAVGVIILALLLSCEKAPAPAPRPATPAPTPVTVPAAPATPTPAIPAPAIPAPPTRPTPLPPEAKSIKALEIAESPHVIEPGSILWQRAAPLQLSLTTAPPANPAINGQASVTGLTVKAIRSRESLFIYLEWNDKTQDLPKADTNSFSDAVAVQFPWDFKTTTSVMMGNPGRVNIWFWSAENQVENLFAEGFGTVSRLPKQNVSGRGIYDNGTWRVVLSHPMDGGPDSGPSLFGVKQTSVAFAVWDGGNKERDGFKAVTLEWVLLQL